MSSITPDLYAHSLELILLVIAAVINLFLAFVVFRSDPQNATNRIFALLSVFTTCWLFTAYGGVLPSIAEHGLIVHRLGIFFAAPQSLLFFLLAHTMPSERIQLSPRSFWLAIGATCLMMIINISPYAFVSHTVTDGVSSPNAGPGILPFSVISTIFSVLAVYFLIRKFLRSSGAQKKQIGYVLLGIFIMLSLIIGTILVPIVIANSLMFLPFSPLYSLVFLGLTAYAITKYRLFNIKVVVAEALTLLICLILFAKMFGEESVNARIIDGIALTFMVVVGFFLIKSVKREVEQRETIEKQERELEIVNSQQEGLLHFISHEIKGYLTKGQNAFAGIIEGDYGESSPGVKALATGALHEMRKGVSTVMDILDASNYKKGTMTFDKKPFDIKKAVLELSDELRFMAEEKGLSLEITFAPSGEYAVVGDEPKLRRHVLRNLIENSIRYTPKGKVTVALSRSGNFVRFSVSDTGVGITEEDKMRLFTQGGKGKDSLRVNVDSTGYGLFVAKQVTDAHGGKISAFSEGQGKGATFTVDLPAS